MRFNFPSLRTLRNCCLAAVAAVLATGCATQQPYDYTAFRQSRPASILVLPPLNSSPDIAATYSMLSQVTLPLAESGYYVFPVSLVDETFRQNGLSNAAEMHSVTPGKLREIFGGDGEPVFRQLLADAAQSHPLLARGAAKLLDVSDALITWPWPRTSPSLTARCSTGLPLPK